MERTSADTFAGMGVQATKRGASRATRFFVTGAMAAERESSQQRHGLASARDDPGVDSKQPE